AQLLLAIADELTGLEVVFVAVPGADEMCLRVGEVESGRGLVLSDPLFHLGDDQTFASWSGLMQAGVAVGVVFAAGLEYADLAIPHEHDPAVTVLDFRILPNKLLGHALHTSSRVHELT